MTINDSALGQQDVRLDVLALRADTPGCDSVIHFNNAGCGLMPKPVLATMLEHLRLEANIGGCEAANTRAAQVDGFYTAIADLIHARPHQIAFAPSATHAFSKALSAFAYRIGDVILTTRSDFISNQLAFLALRKRHGVEIVYAPDRPDGAGVDLDAMAALMRSRRPRLVAATHVSTNSGLVQPVAEIGRYCRELELLYLVDACQSVGQYEIDVEAIGCDMLSATCHKWLRGPRGSGFLYVSERALRLGYEPRFIEMYGLRRPAPAHDASVGTMPRIEEWEFPYATLLGCAEAARYATSLGVKRISHRAIGLAARLRGRLTGISGVSVYDRGPHPSALVTFDVKGWEPRVLKQAMDARGINSSLTFREYARYDLGNEDIEWCMRLSPHCYNTEDEVDAVAAVLEAVAASR